MDKLESGHLSLEQEWMRLVSESKDLRNEINSLRRRDNDLVDPVTGLPNSTAFERHLRSLLDSNAEGGIVYVDVDNFMLVNKMLGRDSGDRLLREIGGRLVGLGISESFCARFSDDKFIAAVHGSKKDIELFCRYLSDEFTRPFCPGEAVLRIETGIGAVLFSDGTANELVDYAHHAMQRSREIGAGYYFFDDVLRGKIERREQILAILRESILQNEIFLVFQPQLVLDTGEVEVIEALLRLKSKEMGFISPAEFIPIAESNGLMLQLGYWVIEAVCEFINRSTYNGVVGVNISPIQILDGDFVEKVTDIVKKTGIDPSRLMLELKEHIIAGTYDRELLKLNGLRKLGVRIAMDNFGTVYSSLNHLAHLPIDTIKIDHSFINGMFIDRRRRVVVRSIIDTAHTLGLRVVAEGVEDEQQRQFLHEIGCDRIQGYAFSAPLDEYGIEEMMDSHGVLT
jgi:diguanylate cyclase (GGDEF)-like protein